MLEHLRQVGVASIQDLCIASGASASTVRRDLEHFEEQGYIERTHGGALIQRQAPRSTFEPEAVIAAHFSRAEKTAIGMLAAMTLSPGQSVIFDSSSTVLIAAQAVLDRGIPLTAVTNDLGIGQALAASPQIRVVVLGGSIRPSSLTLTGEPGQDFLKNINADVAFMGTHAISGTMLTETSLEAAAMKRAMINAARRTVLLADASKFQPPAFCRICDLSSIHEVITDDRASEADIARLRDAGVLVTIAAPGQQASRAA
jgi:DeoR family transcriptional regulator of aga operon